MTEPVPVLAPAPVALPGRRWPVPLLAVPALLLVGAVAVGLRIDPIALDPAGRLAAPSLEHPFGTDHLGRDVLARLVHGAALTLGFTAAAVAVTGVVGTLLGLYAGRRSGVPAQLVLRAVDLLVAVPTVIVGLMLAAVLRPGVGTLMLAVLVTGWTPFARLAYGLARKVGGREYVAAAEALGAGEARILRYHILPNAARPLLAHACLRFANTLLAVAGLSYLGLGAQPPTPEWGAMLAQAQPYLERAPLLVVVPAVAIVVVSLAVARAGRRLESRWDRIEDR